jgi:hypothetical protein
VLGCIFLKEEANLNREPIIELVIFATVLLSVFAHGITAGPTINIYAKQVENLDSDAPERQ